MESESFSPEVTEPVVEPVVGSPSAAEAVESRPELLGSVGTQEAAEMVAAAPDAGIVPVAEALATEPPAVEAAAVGVDIPTTHPPSADPERELKQLTLHKVNGLDEAIDIFISDEPGAGNANHEYLIRCKISDTAAANFPIKFQKGPIAENGVNGLSNESLLAVVEHRLRRFQAGPFCCVENGEALKHVRSALAKLKQRTEDRIKRGVEGTGKP